MVEVNQAEIFGAAADLAVGICGCATPEQRKRDINAILAYRIASTTALQAENERLRGVVEKVTENCRYHRNTHLTATQLMEMLLTIVEPALGDSHV